MVAIGVLITCGSIPDRICQDNQACTVEHTKDEDRGDHRVNKTEEDHLRLAITIRSFTHMDLAPPNS